MNEPAVTASTTVLERPMVAAGTIGGRLSAPRQVAARRTCNLLLVGQGHAKIRDDFRRIGEYVKEICSDVRPVVLRDRRWHRYRPGLSMRPATVMATCKLRRFAPARGAVFQGQNLAKSEEYAALERHGIPVPKWTLLTPYQTPDLADFSEYVVRKPDVGGRGRDVLIKRRGRVRFDPANAKRQLVQQFIYTGPWPISYRVTTFFGEVLYSWKAEANHVRRPLRAPDAFSDGGISILSSAQGCSFELNYDAEILDLAQRAHAAFPTIPLLGVDIIREQPSGKLYVIEVNALGLTWHFSSPMGLGIQERGGFNLEAQFDGLRKAAAILIEQARRHSC